MFSPMEDDDKPIKSWVPYIIGMAATAILLNSGPEIAKSNNKAISKLRPIHKKLLTELTKTRKRKANGAEQCQMSI